MLYVYTTRSRWLLAAALMVVAALPLAGCAVETADEAGANVTARVIVTLDFGGEPVLDETVELAPGTSAMAALKQVAGVDTAYGGGFVTDIDGIRSQSPQAAEGDWFYYINGLSLNEGAASYTLRHGDVQHWDLHPWGFRAFIPAIVGNLPCPFTQGPGGQSRPTVVAYDEGFSQEADSIAAAMGQMGVSNVSSLQISQLADDEKRQANLIIIGTADCELVSEMNAAWDRLGFFAHINGGTLSVYDGEGKPAGEYGAACGLIQATQSPWNPGGSGACENVAWMVSGTDEAGVRLAAEAFASHHGDLQYAFAVIVVGGEIIRVPR